MVERVLAALVASRNEAADDVLLEAVRLGTTSEQHRALDALIRRQTETGVFGLLRGLDALPHDLRLTLLQRAGELIHVLPEAGRHADLGLRVAALRVIALGRLGRLSYVLSENLHYPDETVSAAAADALVSLSRHVASETRRLQGGRAVEGERKADYRRLLEMRPDVEGAVFRALDLHKGARAQELLRAALLLCDSPTSKTMAILSTSRHGGVSPMVKRLQQTPDAENVDAFLLGATHGQLRSQFAVSFAQIEAGPVLDALLRRTYLLKDHRLELCMKQVTRGTWWSEASLIREVSRREKKETAKICDWVAVSGAHDVVQDERLTRVLEAVQEDQSARARMVRLLIRRPRGASLTLLRRFLEDPDETLQRIATREIVRRKPADHSTVLLGMMKTGPASVRRVAGRAISAGAFDNFYDRFDKLDQATRVRAGKAVFKLLPDAITRLRRKLGHGPVEQRIKALQVTQDLGVADELRELVLGLTGHENAKLRSKAVAVAGALKDAVPDLLMDRALSDPDARVRANAIEVLESQRREDYLPLLAQRARANSSRERANAIKALSSLKVEAASGQLILMLRDGRPEHRISALWAARHVGVYKLLNEVVRVARTETDARVRRYAIASVRVAAKQLGMPMSDGPGDGTGGTPAAAPVAHAAVAPALPQAGVGRVFRPADELPPGAVTGAAPVAGGVVGGVAGKAAGGVRPMDLPPGAVVAPAPNRKAG